MPDFNINAIVLRRSHYGETDNILTLYSRERGRISAIAKGARKPVSRLSGASEVLCHSKFSLASARTLQIVRQAEVVSSYSPLRENMERLANALYAAELLSVFVTDGDPNSDLFDLLDAALNLLCAVKNPSLAARWFEIRLLDELGYAPSLTECVVCGAETSSGNVGRLSLSASQGGLVCGRHIQTGGNDDQFSLDRNAVELMMSLQHHRTLPQLYESELLEQIAIDDRLVKAALRGYIVYRTDHVLKSLMFLDTVQKAPSKSQV